MGPPCPAGPRVRAEVSQPAPRARLLRGLDRPLPPAAEAMGADVPWGLGVAGPGAEETAAFLQGVLGGRRLLSSPFSGQRGRGRPRTSRGEMGDLDEGVRPSPWLEACPAAGLHVLCVDPRRWGPGRGLMSVLERGALGGP